MPLAFGAIFGFDALEVDTSNFDPASFDASGLTAASATGVDDGEVAVPMVCQDLTSSNVNFWSCGIAMPAPKQANAPAIIRIALRGDRAWPLAGRGMNLLLFVRVNPRWEAPVTSEPADGLRKSSCRSVRSRGSNRFEGSSS